MRRNYQKLREGTEKEDLTVNMPEFSILSYLQECRKPGVCTVGSQARAILMQMS